MEIQTVARDIKSSLLSIVQDRVDAANKKARRLHVPELSIELGAPFMIAEGKRRTEYTPVTITGNAPKLADWTLIARVEPVGGEVMVHTVPDIDVDVAKWSAVDARWCDHCRKNRRRNETFVVRHEDGREIQVGRNCIADFLGGKEPVAMLAVWEILGDIGDEEFLSGYARTNPNYFEIAGLLQLVLAATKLYGWTSRGAARDNDGLYATADVACDFRSGAGRFDLSSCDRADQRAAVRQDIEKFQSALDNVDLDYIAAMITWAQGLDDLSNNYLHNLGVIARAGATSSRQHVGLAASMPVAYERALKDIEFKARKAAEKATEVLAEVPSGRVQIEGTVLTLREQDSDYGVVYKQLVKVELEDGSFFKVWGSVPSSILSETERGSKVRFMAKVDPKELGFGFYSRPTKAEML